MRISLRRCPPTSALFVDYLESSSRVQAFYPQTYSLESIERFARERKPLDPAHRRGLCEVLAEQQTDWGASQRGVDKLASGAVAVVTGQQPVLFTGPLFSVFKAISAIKIAASLEQAGISAVPVFWVAAEDHDFEEISSAWVLNRNSELCRMGVDLASGEPVPVGWLEFKEDVRTAVSECLANLPQSEFIPQLQHILESSYKPGVSPVAAFARMMAQLFVETDLTFVDPLNDRLKELARPTIELAISRNAEMRAAIIARNQSLAAAGYHAQVKVDENFTGLFEYRGRSRQPVRPNELRNGTSWSPNVLLRPVVQDVLFPTAAYVGGPAEVAYFAQAAAVYETLGQKMPPVFPRISATLIEPRIARILEKYALQLEDVFRGRDHLQRKAVSAIGDDSAFQRVSGSIEAELNSLRPLLSAADETLTGALETSRQKVLHQVESLHGKYVHAVSRRNELMERHLEAICNSLSPEKKQQERVLNVSSFIARYGAGVIPRLLEILSLDTREHQVVEL
jgi:bacillithiol synthase